MILFMQIFYIQQLGTCFLQNLSRIFGLSSCKCSANIWISKVVNFCLLLCQKAQMFTNFLDFKDTNETKMVITNKGSRTKKCFFLVVETINPLTTKKKNTSSKEKKIR